MRPAIVVVLCLVLGWTGSTSATSTEWERASIGQGETMFVSVAIDPTKSHHLVAASPNAVFESIDGGRSWQERFRALAQITIHDLAVEAATILVATDQGLYGSFDGGTQWARPHRGLAESENDCTFVAFHPGRPGTVFLGTRGGLWVSTDEGRFWTKMDIPLASRDIVSFASDPADPDRLHVVTSDGLLTGNLRTSEWQRRFSVVNAAEPDAAEPPDASEGTEPVEPEEPLQQLRTVAIDPQQPSTLYLGGSRGVQVSYDSGSTWQRFSQAGLMSPGVSQLLPYIHSPLVIYAATAQGVARYEPSHEHWTILVQGLISTQINDLAANDHALWAATDQGLYRYQMTPDPFAVSEPPSAQELLSNFSHEPTIAQVREAAIRYAEVHPNKIRNWRRQAALQALLPTVDVGLDHDSSRNVHVDEGSFPNFQILETQDRDLGLDLSVKWDLGELIWNNDQTSIDVRSKLMAQLRDDVVDQVTRTYFERRRLQVKLLTDPPPEQHPLLEKELRLQELTALLDGLTGGYFSKQMDISSIRR